MKKLTEAKPALTTGARKPNDFGLEKWNKTMLMAAKKRRPVSAFSRAGLGSGRSGVRVSTAC